MPDCISIAGLEVDCHIGVPDEERAVAQRLLIDLRLFPRVPFDALDDDIAQTVDYSLVSTQAREWAAEEPLKLIETLAAKIAENLLRHHPITAVEVEVRKFILPETRFVSVTLRRENTG